MPASRSVRVERNRLRFAAAHMATFAGDCEPLHGHNYDLFVEVEGELTDESWVIDFSLIKQLARERSAPDWTTIFSCSERAGCSFLSSGTAAGTSTLVMRDTTRFHLKT